MVVLRAHPDLPVLMLSTYENASYALRAIAQGASGYVLKGISRDELVEAMKATLEGRPWSTGGAPDPGGRPGVASVALAVARWPSTRQAYLYITCQM